MYNIYIINKKFSKSYLDICVFDLYYHVVRLKNRDMGIEKVDWNLYMFFQIMLVVNPALYTFLGTQNKCCWWIVANMNRLCFTLPTHLNVYQ